jgi:hypothetical protein
MRFLSTIIVACIACATAHFQLTDDYHGVSFLQEFDFFQDQDPTDGHVKYQSLSTSLQNGLVGVVPEKDNAVFLTVDAQQAEASQGRNSVRLTSRKTYNHGLFIADIAHMPANIPGVWPAYWLLGTGATWPAHGEVDILEGVNMQKGNAMTLHTSSNCAIKGGRYSGKLATPNCDVEAVDQDKNAGCSITSQDASSYGDSFNIAGGGVYATLWNSSTISIWHFKRSSIPEDITSTKPNPTKWGQPAAQFGGACDIDSHFKDHSIIFNTALCGQWAGRVWSDCKECMAKASTCQEFVTNNPKAFEQAYWLINSVRVYDDLD